MGRHWGGEWRPGGDGKGRMRTWVGLGRGPWVWVLWGGGKMPPHSPLFLPWFLGDHLLRAVRKRREN